MDTVKLRSWIVVLAGTAMLVAVANVLANPLETKTDMPAPGCASASATQTSLAVQACADATGFSLQGVTANAWALAATSGLVTALSDFNEGATSPGHCA